MQWVRTGKEDNQSIHVTRENVRRKFLTDRKSLNSISVMLTNIMKRNAEIGVLREAAISNTAKWFRGEERVF